MTAGRVGKPHGLDGSFYVERPRHELPEGAEVTLSGRAHRIVRRAGTDERPLIRLAGLDDPGARRGASCCWSRTSWGRGSGSRPTSSGSACRGMGKVAQVIDAPSCSVLELEDGTLIPLVSDAVRSVDLDAGEIEVDRDFLG